MAAISQLSQPLDSSDTKNIGVNTSMSSSYTDISDNKRHQQASIGSICNTKTNINSTTTTASSGIGSSITSNDNINNNHISISINHINGSNHHLDNERPPGSREFEVEVNVIKSKERIFTKGEDYPMDSKERGICLIINNVKFEVSPYRKGSDMDAFKFRHIFKQLGFAIDVKRNVKSDKMREYFKSVASRCKKEHNALVVIILSHGTEFGILGCDDYEVDLNDILIHFDNEHCKNMIHKPKIFFIQACRGRKIDSGVRYISQTLFTQSQSQLTTQFTKLADSQFPRLTRWADGVDHKYTPTRTDMLLCFSCPFGYVSVRNEDEGTWVGESLARHLEKESHHKHLLEILNMVSRDVRRRKSDQGYKQVVEVTSIGFDKNLYFNPGWPDLVKEDQATSTKARIKTRSRSKVQNLNPTQNCENSFT